MHIIRLRHPWQKQIAGASESVRVQVPEPTSDDQAQEHHAEHATYTRFFNRPTGLEPDSSVLLRLDRWQGELTLISLNDKHLVTNERPSQSPLEINITSNLAQRNELCIVLTTQNDAEGRLTGQVELAIVD